MPRNMSFRLTTDQIKNRTKTVTRRVGWDCLKPGEIVNACVKCMGFKKGEKIERLCQIRIVDVRQERLVSMHVYDPGNMEARLEGFPKMSNQQFIDMFCENMKCDEDTEVNRIEFEYVDGEST